jgi:cyclopropane fatty-acyl-phospholipid synthase-like methyltransferase
MDEVIKQYREQFQKHGNSINSLFIPKGRQKERFDSLIREFKNDFSILDYGCGLGHLKAYLDNKFTNFKYTGVDIVNEFIEQSNQNYNKANFYLINSVQDIKENFDHIVAAGVFNMLYDKDIVKHKKIVFDTISYLFSITNKSLAVNFMTDQVDFIQEGAYHQNILEIYSFITENLSKRLILDQSYMPYEYSVIIFKDQEILRPDNIYAEITKNENI